MMWIPATQKKCIRPITQTNVFEQEKSGNLDRRVY
jgi:hypothetical protein